MTLIINTYSHFDVDYKSCLHGNDGDLNLCVPVSWWYDDGSDNEDGDYDDRGIDGCDNDDDGYDGDDLDLSLCDPVSGELDNGKIATTNRCLDLVEPNPAKWLYLYLLSVVVSVFAFSCLYLYFVSMFVFVLQQMVGLIS